MERTGLRDRGGLGGHRLRSRGQAPSLAEESQRGDLRGVKPPPLNTGAYGMLVGRVFPGLGGNSSRQTESKFPPSFSSLFGLFGGLLRPSGGVLLFGTCTPRRHVPLMGG